MSDAATVKLINMQWLPDIHEQQCLVVWRKTATGDVGSTELSDDLPTDCITVLEAVEIAEDLDFDLP